MLIVKNQAEIRQMRESGRLWSQLAAELHRAIEVGVSGKDLERIAFDFARSKKIRLSFLGYRGYPSPLCVAVNQQVVHNIPTGLPFKAGDIVTVDLGVEYQGFHTDAAFTKAVGAVSQQAKDLIWVTRAALEAGVRKIKAGVLIREIGAAIEEVVKRGGFKIVIQFTGHGIGRQLHEDPLIPNYAVVPDRLGKIALREGMTVALEPVTTAGTGEVRFLKDGWSTETIDGSLACQFEVTVLVGKSQAEVLTRLPSGPA